MDYKLMKCPACFWRVVFVLFLAGSLFLLNERAHAVEVLVDDLDAGESTVGAWSTQNNTSAFRGSAITSNSLNATSTYLFSGLTTGSYDIYLHWPAHLGTVPDTSVPVDVKHTTGIQRVFVDQSTNGAQWNLLGAWTLDSTSTVTITNDSGTLFPVYSDAVRLVTAEGSPGGNPISVFLTVELPGNDVNLIWATQNAASCNASGGWSGAKSVSGMELIQGVLTNTTFTLTCDAPPGVVPATDMKSVAVTVGGSTAPTPTTLPVPPPDPIPGAADIVTATKTGTAPTINGIPDEAMWNLSNTASKPVIGAPNNPTNFDVAWDDTYLYVAVSVIDFPLNNDSVSTFNDDSVEVYIDSNHSHSVTYDATDFQFTKGFGDSALLVTGGDTTGVLHGFAQTDLGYTVELGIPWTKLGVTTADQLQLGFDIGVNDDDQLGARDSQLMWFGNVNNFSTTEFFGHVQLAGTPGATTTTTTTTVPLPPPVTTALKGLNIQAHTGTFNDAAERALVLDLGAKAIRLGFGHGRTLAAITADADWAVANNKEVLFMLGYSEGCDISTATGRQCYADRSASLATGFGTKVKYYQVWNEWNGGLGLGCNQSLPKTDAKVRNCWAAVNPSAATCITANCSPRTVQNENVILTTDTNIYKDLLCRTNTAIKAVVPAAIVTAPVTAGPDPGFLDRLLQKAGAGACFDYLDVHPYAAALGGLNLTPVAAVDRFAAQLANLRSIMITRLGSAKSMIVTEEGIQAYDTATQTRQAGYITELYRRANNMPGLVGIWWFAFKDNVDGQYGLVRTDNTKKPGYTAYKAAPGG